MGCGASTPSSTKYVAADDARPENKDMREPVQSTAKKDYLDAIKVRQSVVHKYDVVLSFEPSYSPNLYDVVSTELGKKYVLGDRSLAAIAESSRLVIFLSPPYFSNAACCAEFCEAVKAGVEVAPVLGGWRGVEGVAAWLQ